MKGCSGRLHRVNVRKAVRASAVTLGLVGITAFTAAIGRTDAIQTPSVYIEDGSGNLVLAPGATIDPEGGVHWDFALIGHLDPNDDTVVDDSAGDAVGTVVYGN